MFVCSKKLDMLMMEHSPRNIIENLHFPLKGIEMYIQHALREFFFSIDTCIFPLLNCVSLSLWVLMITLGFCVIHYFSVR